MKTNQHIGTIASQLANMNKSGKTKPVRTPRTKEVKAAEKAKTEIPKLKAGYVYEAEDGHIVAVNAASVASVQPVEIKQGFSTMHHLALNFLAGHVHPEITDAYKTDLKKENKHAGAGALQTLFGGRSAKSTVSQVRKILAVKTTELYKAWNNYVLQQKRTTPASINGLVKALAMVGKATKVNEPKKASGFRHALAEKLKTLPEDEINALPAWLFDMLLDYKIILVDDAEAPKTESKSKQQEDDDDEE